MSNLDIKLIDDTVISGSAPLVLIGPNGSGKSRMANALSARPDYQLISAIRTPIINFESNASGHAERRAINFPISNILSEFLNEELWKATEYTQKHRLDPAAAGSPPTTQMSRLIDLFSIIFPGRKMQLGNRSLDISWTTESRTTEVYSSRSMSDGEKAGVELIARLLRAEPGIVIVDEPEVHLHPLLAREFWTRVESFRSDCRFIYITHDLPFALSRTGARIGIVRDEKTVQLIDENSPIPEDLVESLLGAATVSVVARRIIFCEGKTSGSIDQSFYSAWFLNNTCAVAPMGSCERVRNAVLAMNNSPVLANAEIVGIVDRDYWPSNYLEKLNSEGLFVLPFHELESLLCIKGVALAIGRHLGQESIDNDYNDFLISARSGIKGIELSKLVLERSKREIEIAIIGLSNSAAPHKDIAVTKSNFTSVVVINKAVPDVSAVFDRQQKIVQDALNGAADEFLKIIPGKHCLTLLSQKIGIKREKYIGLVQKALREVPNGPLKQLHAELVQALQPHLPPR